MCQSWKAPVHAIVLLVRPDIPVEGFLDADDGQSVSEAVGALDVPYVVPAADVPEDPAVTILLKAPLFERYQCSKRSSFMIEDVGWIAAHLLIVTAVITPTNDWRWS